MTTGEYSHMAKISLNLESIKTYEKTERLKLKDGQTVFRILPPFGDVEVHNNYPYRRWSVAWLNDPRSGKRRPYGSPMSSGKDAPCPVNEFSKALTAYIERTKSKLVHQGLSDAEIKEDLAILNKTAWELKVNHVYAYNVATKDGKIAVLEVKSTVHKGLKRLMGDYIKTYGQDPTSLTSSEDDSGVWFSVERSGMNRDTEYSVDFNQIKTRLASGKITKEDDRSPLSPHIEENYATSGYDLSTLYKTLTYDEIKVVLMSNLAVLAESDVRLGQIPGFFLDESADPTFVPEEVVAKPIKTGTVKTVLALDDANDVEDDEEPPFEVTPTAVPPKAKTASNARKLADSLLDD
jgi:hypothetical protein